MSVRDRGPVRRTLPHALPGRDEAVDEEIRHHLEERIERLIEQGVEPDEARREATRRFGDVTRVRAEVRAVDRHAVPVRALAAVVHELSRDLRIAVRSLRRSPWFASAVIATLGVGVGANVAIFSVVESVLLRPLPFPAPDGIVYLYQTFRPGGSGPPAPTAVAPANYLDWQAQLGSFEAMAAITDATVRVVEGGDPERIPGSRVSRDYFRVLGVEPELGRTFTADEDVPGGPNVVVVSHAFWSTRLAGDPDVVGRSVRLDGAPYTVIGVMPESFRAYSRFNSQNATELWRPYGFGRDAPTERAVRRLGAIGRLRDGISLEQAQSELDALAVALERQYPETNEGTGAIAIPLPEALREAARAPVLLLLGAVAFVLLIACLNVGNLLLARSDVRRTTVTLRRVLGAGRARVVRELLTESFALSVAGAALGVVVAWSLLPILVTSSPVDLTRLGRVEVNRSVLAFSAALAVLVALLTGLVPALAITAPDLGRELKERGLGRTESSRARAGKSTLVVTEVALSVVLVVGATLMLESYGRLSGIELGFDPQGVVRVGALLPRDQYAEPVGVGSRPQTRNFTLWRPRPEELAFKERVRDAMLRVPGVESVAGGNFDPFPGLMWASTLRAADTRASDPEEAAPFGGVRAVSPGWVETVRIPVVRGRFIDELDRERGQDVVVLDEGAARKLWPGQEAIGRSVLLADGVEDEARPFQVVGVVASTRQALFDNGGEVFEGDSHAAYIPYRAQAEAYVDWQIDFRMRSVFLVRTERDLSDVGPELRQAVASVDPELPITLERLADTVASPLDERRFYMAMLVAFGVLALLLAASGVFAVMAYSVSRKTRELGIRLALGALAGDLLLAELRRGVRLASLGMLVGGLGAVFLTRFIESFLYGVDPVNPATYAGVAALILSVVLAAAYVPARRASTTDPIESLRAE